MRHFQASLPAIAVIALLIAAWWTAVIAAHSLIFPTPWAVVAGTWELVHNGTLGQHITASLTRVFIGFGLAVCVGVPLGLWMGWVRGAYRTLNPIFQILRPISPIAWIPIAILWFGIDEGGKIFVIFIGTFFPILLNTIAGTKSIDPVLIRAGRILGCTDDASLFRKVVLPASLPQVIVGLRISFGTGWASIIAAELVAARSGLGYLISNGMEVLRSDFVLVGMVTIGALGVLFDGVFRWVDARYNWIGE